MSESYGAFCECDFDEYSAFYTVQRRKAKKQHKCGECNSVIKTGETYEYAVGKTSDGMWDSKTCACCLALVDWITAHVPCYCRTHGDLFEDRLNDLVRQARQTPGFAFGMLRRVVACRRNADERRTPA